MTRPSFRWWVVTALCAGVTSGSARTVDRVSCDQFLPQRDVKGAKVGPRSCLLQQTKVTLDGRAYRRVDIGLDGTVDG